MRILDPTIREAAPRVAFTPAPRPRSLAGATIGLLANSKSNSMALLDRLAELLRERHGIGELVRVTKKDLKAPMSDADAAQFVGRCTAVITAIGD